METLSPEHRAVLELYKKERPDIFARLPLPKKLAEEMGVPISSETVHLMDFMKSHMSIVNGHYDEAEVKVACKITDASGVEIVGEPTSTEPMENIWKKASEFQVRAQQNENNNKARQAFFKQSENLENRIEMNLISSQSEPALHIIEGGTNAAAVPQ